MDFKRTNIFFLRLDKRTEDLSEAISSVAKDVTRVVVEIQDTKRQALLKHTRDALSAEVQIRKKWRQLIERLIHERYSIACVVTYLSISPVMRDRRSMANNPLWIAS